MISIRNIETGLGGNDGVRFCFVFFVWEWYALCFMFYVSFLFGFHGLRLR